MIKMKDPFACFECGKSTDCGWYETDCTEGYGTVGFCKECIIKLAKEGFSDEHTICHCGEQMCLIDEEYLLETIRKDGVICYLCESCDKPEFVGLHVIQPDEIDDQVWDGTVEPDDLEYEYIYDYDYALEYHRDNTDLYGKKYNERWQYMY